MKPSVLVYRDIPDDILTRLSAECDVHRVAEIDPDIDPSVKPLLAGADAILGSGGKIDARFLAMAPKLRVASTITVGYDNFDVSALSARNVVLMHTGCPDRNRCRCHDGTGAGDCTENDHQLRAGETRRVDRKYHAGLVRL